MPGDPSLGAARPVMHPLAARRILRLAFGTALSLWFSQAIAWPLSFMAPVLTMFILALPLPAPSLRKGLMLVVAMLAPMLAGMALLPFLHHARWVGILLLALALFQCFYYTARGGSAALGSFMTMGLTLMVTIGSVNPTVMFLLIKALGIGAVSGLAFVWLAHAFLPDPICGRMPEPVKRRTVAEKPQLAGARRRALRALLIVLPMALLFLFMSGSPAYTVVMIKVASMGQQASSEKGRELGTSLLQSTLAGGAGAIVAWNLLSIWPSLVLYSLLYFAPEGSWPPALAALADRLRELDPQCRVYTVAGSASADCRERLLVDEGGGLYRHCEGGPGVTYLVRPDRHVAGRWKTLQPEQVLAAMRRALGRKTA